MTFVYMKLVLSDLFVGESGVKFSEICSNLKISVNFVTKCRMRRKRQKSKMSPRRRNALVVPIIRGGLNL